MHQRQAWNRVFLSRTTTTTTARTQSNCWSKQNQQKKISSSSWVFAFYLLVICKSGNENSTADAWTPNCNPNKTKGKKNQTNEKSSKENYTDFRLVCLVLSLLKPPFLFANNNNNSSHAPRRAIFISSIYLKLKPKTIIIIRIIRTISREFCNLFYFIWNRDAIKYCLCVFARINTLILPRFVGGKAVTLILVYLFISKCGAQNKWK